jgi:hypothetical protein
MEQKLPRLRTVVGAYNEDERFGFEITTSRAARAKDGADVQGLFCTTLIRSA